MTEHYTNNNQEECCSQKSCKVVVKSPPSEQNDCCGDSCSEGIDKFDWQKELIPIAIATILWLIGLIFADSLRQTPFSIAEYLILIPAYLISGWNVLTTAGRNILRGAIFDENFLMTIATLGAIAIREIPEAVGVMLFFRVGEFVQGLAVGRSRRSIQSLLEVRPDTANLLLNNGEVMVVSPHQVKIGDRLQVRVGEKIPLDGEIITGNSLVDASALTGESIPRQVGKGKQVLAGMINQSGTLTIRVTKPFEQSSIVRILELVENARSKKADTEKFITRFARYYTPVVVLLSLGVALFPPLLITGENFNTWTYRALVLLVISCPCGLVK